MKIEKKTIITIIILAIISISLIITNFKCNTTKVKAEEQWQPIQVTLNEDLSNRNFIFNMNYINNFNIQENTIYGYYYIQTEVAINNNTIIYYIQFEARETYINISIIATINNNNNYIYNAQRTSGQQAIVSTNNTTYTSLIYTTTSNFNNYTTSTTHWVNWYNNVAKDFFLFEPKEQIETPTLTRELNTLIWTDIENATYELYKDNQLLVTTNQTRYTALNNGVYKVRAVVDNNYSDYSNNIEITNIEEQGYFTFLTLFGNIADSQLYLLQSMLNFEILGFNLYQLFTALITLCIIIIVCKIAIFK